MENTQKLFELACSCRLNAYTPYSHFKVGAALLSGNHKFFCGCNVENASYPCGTCAEAGAISAMAAAGETKILEILIVADTPQILPCGNCLQKILEFGDDNTLVHSADLNGSIKTFRLYDLIPHFFKAGDIKNAD
ncbi:MAG: cytidine deaminase [Pseudomonadota bacterium]|nr:cytidine deaminase [Pseudomonadota bacterium]